MRELAPMPATTRTKREAKKANRPHFTPPNFIQYRRGPKVNPDALPRGMDPIRQNDHSRLGIPVEPTVVIEGIEENTSEVGVPDTNGDVSPDHYVQIVNASFFQVFSKDGTPLTPPTSANTIWNEINQQSFSDPVIIYDEDAGRWLLTDLANIDQVLYGVSETSDPLGAWDLYLLETPGFADYPKYGVWPNAYIFTINEGGGVYPVYALNRQQLLAGEAEIDVQRLEIPGLNGGFPAATPMDWNSPNQPPTDEVFVVRLNDDAWGNGNATDQLELWTIQIDWGTPANSTATPLILPVAAYDTDGCSVNNGSFACIPQPGTDQGIDGIMTIIMNNVAYWNYGTHESAVLTFSVDAGGDVAGIRWVELRRLPTENWSVYQEGTYAPNDSIHRFIGGIAINGKGDIGLAYSVSGENTFPSLRFTGRRAGDPLGEMTIDEFEFATGSGVRDFARYGDYARMSVDPVNGSFWFTSEYVKTDGSFGTKIVNFSIRRDTFDLLPISLDAPQNSPDLTAAEPVTIQVKNLGLEPATGITVGYILDNGTPVVEPAAVDTLFPDSIYLHTFGEKADLSLVGEYRFKVFATFAQDQNILNDTLRRVRRKLPRFDTGITGLEGLDGIQCDSFATVHVTFTNFGTEPLDSVEVVYQLNANALETIHWTGNLPSGESAAVGFQLTPLTSGTNSIAVKTNMPNGTADEIPANDSFAREFQVQLEGKAVHFELNLDFYPEETSWQLADAGGNVIFSGDNYGGMIEETITETWCLLDDACYTFTIFDFFGDGLTSFDGPPGSYTIKDAEGNVLASIIEANFGYQENNEFCLRLPCSLAAEVATTNESASGSSDGALLVTVTSGVSPFTFSIDGGATSQSEPLFSGLEGGVYTVIVKDANGCSIELESTVGTIVATGNPQQTYSITVFPNPSGNGAFGIKVQGWAGVPELDLQVVDLTGRPVLYQTLPAVDDYHQGIVSLKAFPAGVYYLRFRNEKMNELVKLIRL